MALQTIGVGVSANDGTGDPARTAFQKTNANFVELYAGTPLQYQDLSALDASTLPFTRFSAQAFNINGPYSTRNDVVWVMGHNYGPGGRVDASDAGMGLKFESFYFEPAITTRSAGFEFHLEITDTAGSVHRPIYSWFPRDGAAGGVFQYQADNFTFRPFDKNHPYYATAAVQIGFGSVGSPGTQLYFTQKGSLNYQIARNAGQALFVCTDNAGTGSVSASVTTGDAISFTAAGGIWVTGAGAGSSTFTNTTVGIACNTPGGAAPADGARGIYMGHGIAAYSGTFYLIDTFGRADDNIIRSRTDQIGSKAGFAAQIKDGATTDAYYRVERPGGLGTWTWGNKGSDNSWRLSRGTALGTNDVMIVDSSNVLTLAIPRSTTAALAAIGDAINTTNKISGKTLINTTTGAIVTAAGATAGSVWKALDGTTAHTPV